MKINGSGQKVGEQQSPLGVFSIPVLLSAAPGVLSGSEEQGHQREYKYVGQDGIHPRWPRKSDAVRCVLRAWRLGQAGGWKAVAASI